MTIREYLKMYRSNEGNIKYQTFSKRLYTFYCLVFPKLENWERKLIEKRKQKDIKNGTYKNGLYKKS